MRTAGRPRWSLFLSTPSGWRATASAGTEGIAPAISIHALRVEGDAVMLISIGASSAFLSTPSGWRATPSTTYHFNVYIISIHALRVEGDVRTCGRWRTSLYFYPRPPGGGRLPRHAARTTSGQFLSTPSGWRATGQLRQAGNACEISIHALRVEGDILRLLLSSCTAYFYPRPPGGGRR